MSPIVTKAVAVGEPPDGLLVVARLAAEQGQLPAEPITAAARTCAATVATMPAERLRQALQDVIMAERLEAGLEWLHLSGILAVALPELDETVGFSQEAGRRHKDVWEHTKQVVRQATATPVLRWAALLHDVGKVPTRVIQPDGSVTFHRHAEVGARMWDGISRRLAFPREERQRIRFLILHHLRANAYTPAWTDAAVRRFDKEMADHLDELLDLSRADVTSRRPGRRQEAADNIQALRTRIMAVREMDAKVPPLPPGLGNSIMEVFGIPPSKRVGDLRKLCEDACERGELEERREAEYYIEYLRAHMPPGPSAAHD